MNSLFWVKCTAAMAEALGAVPRKRIPRPGLSFQVYEAFATHHADLHTEAGLYAWPWTLDRNHPTITVIGIDWGKENSAD